MTSIPVPIRNKAAIVLFCVALITSQFAYSQTCIASGPNSPASSASVASGGGDLSFASPGNVYTSNNSYTTASTLVSLFNGNTASVQATNFNFSIPASAVICGIEAEIEKSATNIGFNIFLLESYVTDLNVQLIKGGSVIGSNHAQSAHWTGTDGYTTYGGSSDDWDAGSAWLPADINASNFGISFSARINDLVGLMPVARIDHIRLTVYYYDPGLLVVGPLDFAVTGNHNQTALLQWKAVDQNETTNYNIQRSSDGVQWETLQGKPQVDEVSKQYSFTDTRPLPGQSYYRLKLTNPAGAIQYSGNRLFNFSTYTRIKAYPNPCTSYLQITDVSSEQRLTITNIYGQNMPVRYTTTANGQKIDVSALLPGVYYISTGNQKIKFQKK
jgi:hypothetical protein